MIIVYFFMRIIFNTNNYYSYKLTIFTIHRKFRFLVSLLQAILVSRILFLREGANLIKLFKNNKIKIFILILKQT